MKNLLGIHHVTAITSDAKKIYEFYTQILGMRLVKKNVNQDDIKTYHLFFADDIGSPGTDMTFFDFQGISAKQEGNNEIARTGFRVTSDAALDYWLQRFAHYDIKHSEIKTRFKRKYIEFEDFDQQKYALYSDENVPGVAAGTPWQWGPVPNEYAIVGLGPITLRVSDVNQMHQILVQIMKFEHKDSDNQYLLYETGAGGNGASVIIEWSKNPVIAHQGYGAVHHVAFRVEDTNHLLEWKEYFDQLNLRNSGYVDRHYFESLYIRLYPNILFELATDGPGFIDDQETYETLGQTLTLPPHLRQYEDYVYETLKPFDSSMEKPMKKEYFND